MAASRYVEEKVYCRYVRAQRQGLLGESGVSVTRLPDGAGLMWGGGGEGRKGNQVQQLENKGPK